MLFLHVRRAMPVLRSGRQTATLLSGFVSFAFFVSSVSVVSIGSPSVVNAQPPVSTPESSRFVGVTPWAQGASRPADSISRDASPKRDTADYVRLVDRRSRRSDGLMRSALSCRGVPYVRGGTSRGGFDCSGFTRYVYARQGVSLPRTAADQSGVGTRVSRDELRSGDLVFFAGTYKRGISHVGIYVGDGNFIHAPRTGSAVRIDDLDSSYYRAHWAFGRRVK